MSSYPIVGARPGTGIRRDYNREQRRAYWGPRMRRRTALRIKAGRVLFVLFLLWVGLMKVAYGGGRTGTEQLVVQPGQTVWSIAQARYPDDDVRSRVQQIDELNHLGAQAIYPGEKLAVPAR